MVYATTSSPIIPVGGLGFHTRNKMLSRYIIINWLWQEETAGLSESWSSFGKLHLLHQAAA